MQKSVDIFLSYAIEDQELCLKLKKHLKWLELEGLVRIWHEHNISAGQEREREIYRYLDHADIILPLISVDFINNDFCYRDQLERATKRYEQGSARVIPIILRTIHWQKTPLGEFQALPSNNIPINKWLDLDEVLEDIAQEIHLVVKELIARRYVQESQHLLGAGQYEKAVEACNSAQDYTSDSVAAYQLKGLALFALKKYDDALTAYEQAILLDRTIASTYKEKGDVLYILNRYSEAVISYQEAITRKSDFAGAYLAGSEALYQLAEEYNDKGCALLASNSNSNQEDQKWYH